MAVGGGPSRKAERLQPQHCTSKSGELARRCVASTPFHRSIPSLMSLLTIFWKAGTKGPLKDWTIEEGTRILKKTSKCKSHTHTQRNKDFKWWLKMRATLNRSKEGNKKAPTKSKPLVAMPSASIPLRSASCRSLWSGKYSPSQINGQHNWIHCIFRKGRCKPFPFQISDSMTTGMCKIQVNASNESLVFQPDVVNWNKT